MLDEIVILVLLAAAAVALLVVFYSRSRRRGSLADALAPPPSPRTLRARESEAAPDVEATGSGLHLGSARPRADGSALR